MEPQYDMSIISVMLIVRELSWHDVAFYNADLYEGLRRMIRDVESVKNNAEDFKATYCCYFEVRDFVASKYCSINK